MPATLEVAAIELPLLGRAYAYARGLPEHLGRRTEVRLGGAGLDASLRTEAGKSPVVVSNLSITGARIAESRRLVSKGATVELIIPTGLLRRVHLAGGRSCGLVSGQPESSSTGSSPRLGPGSPRPCPESGQGFSALDGSLKRLFNRDRLLVWDDSSQGAPVCRSHSNSGGRGS